VRFETDSCIWERNKEGEMERAREGNGREMKGRERKGRRGRWDANLVVWEFSSLLLGNRRLCFL